MLPMTLMILTNITQDLQKHLLKIDTETIYHILIINNNKNKTELSKYVWSLNNKNKNPIINWKMMKTIYSKAASKIFKLCLMEKLYILNALGDERSLNKRTEFISKCRHQNKLLLKNVKDSMD